MTNEELTNNLLKGIKVFKDLSPEEETSYRQWARDNYTPYSDIKGVWHLAVQSECVLINMETEAKAKHVTYAEWAKKANEIIDCLKENQG